MDKKIKIATIIVLAILVGGGSFYGGMKFEQSQSANKRADFAGGNFQGVRTNGNNTGSGMTSGSIISKDDKSITLQLPNNAGSKIIFYSDSTEISKFSKGLIDDLNTGDNIMVSGKSNTDGSITAQTIQMRPTDLGQNNQPPAQ
jgi:hypothetical protein